MVRTAGAEEAKQGDFLTHFRATLNAGAPSRPQPPVRGPRFFLEPLN